MPSDTLIFIATYDERQNVRSICEQILALGLDADVLFMDDASPDGTGVELDRLAAEHSRVRVIHRPARLGVGSAQLAAIRLAYDEGYARLVTLDGEFAHSPRLIPTFLARS